LKRYIGGGRKGGSGAIEAFDVGSSSLSAIESARHKFAADTAVVTVVKLMHHKRLMIHDRSLQLKGYKPEPTSPLKLIQEFSIR